MWAINFRNLYCYNKSFLFILCMCECMYESITWKKNFINWIKPCVFHLHKKLFSFTFDWQLRIIEFFSTQTTETFWCNLWWFKYLSSADDTHKRNFDRKVFHKLVWKSKFSLIIHNILTYKNIHLYFNLSF